MHINFNFLSVPNIIFGQGKLNAIDNILKNYGNKILVVSGKSSFFSTNKGAEFKQMLEKQGKEVVYVSVASEPTPEFIDSTCEEYSKNNLDVIVAIGGGSTIDAGKAISAMIKLKDPVKNYLEGVGDKKHPGTKIPFIAIPTTSGTGSETTSNAVLSEVGIGGFKKSLRQENLIPNHAIIDPELTLSCPSQLTATTGLDAFTQLLESYLSTKASPLTDSLALDGLRHIAKSLDIAFSNGTNIEARSSLAYSSMLSGITLANAGLGTVHGFASAIGGVVCIPHGVVCGMLMPDCNESTVKYLRKNDKRHIALKKYAIVGKLFSTQKNMDDNYYIDSLIDRLHKYKEQFGIRSLSDFGVSKNMFSEIIKNTGNKNNPASLPESELTSILDKNL